MSADGPRRQRTAAGVSVASENSNWILYDFDWSNA